MNPSRWAVPSCSAKVASTPIPRATTSHSARATSGAKVTESSATTNAITHAAIIRGTCQ